MRNEYETDRSPLSIEFNSHPALRSPLPDANRTPGILYLGMPGTTSSGACRRSAVAQRILAAYGADAFPRRLRYWQGGFDDLLQTVLSDGRKRGDDHMNAARCRSISTPRSGRSCRKIGEEAETRDFHPFGDIFGLLCLFAVFVLALVTLSPTVAALFRRFL